MTVGEPQLEITTSGTSDRERAGRSLAAEKRAVARAWESFASGEGAVEGVRPEILASWYRCRDQYEVDPALNIAPGAPDYNDHRFENDVIFAKLGGLAALAGQEVELDGGIVAVTDGTGRLLGSWGDPAARKRAELSNLAPWSAWSERCAGTNGMGTSFEVSGPVTVTGPEHWCEGFHQWACAGIAVRDVVTGSPIASINVSRWGDPLSEHLPVWLAGAAASVERDIHRRAIWEGKSVIAAFTHERSQTTVPLMALDLGGRVIAANEAATSLLAIPCDNAAFRAAADPAGRWRPDIPELSDVVWWAVGQSLRSPHWTGSAQLAVTPAEEAVPTTMRPIHAANRLVGMLCVFGSQEGEPYNQPSKGSSGALPARVIGMRQDRLVVLAPSEIRYAEADRNTVWLSTDRGRIQAATRGLENVDQALAPHGFRRVHRRFLVNLRRVAELERGTKGELFLITDPRVAEGVPVSRRHAPEIRRLLGV